MIKGIKAIAFIIALCVNLGCGENKSNDIKAALEKTLQANGVKNVSVNIKDVQNGLILATFSINTTNDGGSIQDEIPILATQDGKFIFNPDSFMAQDKSMGNKIKDFYKEVYAKRKARIDSALKAIFKQREQEAFVFKAKKPTDKVIYIVSDANCPYCQKEFSNIQVRLQEANVKMFIVGFLGADSESKAAFALKHKTDNDANNLALLKDIYQPNSKVKADDTKQANELTSEIINIGIESVPYIIE